MSRLETRVKRLETATPEDNEAGLSGVIRTYLDERGKEIRCECLLDPVAPRKLPQVSDLNATDAKGSTSRRPTIANYIDTPWKMTRTQTAIWKRLLSNRSRSVDQIPFTSEQAEEWSCLWKAALAAGGDQMTISN